MSKKKKRKQKSTELSCTVKGKIVQIRKTMLHSAWLNFSPKYSPNVLDSVSHALGERNYGRLSCNMRVQFTDAYPAIGECNIQTLIQQKESVIHRRISCNK